jgi:hypothetical protein
MRRQVVFQSFGVVIPVAQRCSVGFFQGVGQRGWIGVRGMGVYVW